MDVREKLVELPIEDALLVLREEHRQRTDSYTTYLAHGGKGDPAEEVGLDALAMAISALEKTKWISVKDRLPENVKEGLLIALRWGAVDIGWCEDGIPYMESRYFGFHAQTISLCYTADVIQWMNSCNSRTENNFADEINYVYRLMRHELIKAIDVLTDPLSKKLWMWLLTFSDRKSFYKRDHTYNNDFSRYPTPENYDFGERAHNDWRKSSWKIELEKMYNERPELLLQGEAEMIENWMKLEANNIELPADYDKDDKFTAYTRIKEMDYYRPKYMRV